MCPEDKVIEEWVYHCLNAQILEAILAFLYLRQG